LILIQIDGLSATQLRQALRAGRMPCCERLLLREHYQLHSFYSGLPSSTPSVQGELFYGVRCAVPAFSFRDHRDGTIRKMFYRDAARDVQERLSSLGEPLLAGGSAYCNIYDGGAAESHFCASSLGWDEVLKHSRPYRWIILLSRYGWPVLRALGLATLELALAIGGFVRGAMTGREWWQEVMMIPARVVVVILMREFATIGASIDAARGLPVIHINLLGYDEQAHRRGPDSSFAHWTLKGVDGAIRRIWRAAHASNRRHYDLWIYSDHGQEVTTPYPYVSGQSVHGAVRAAMESLGAQSPHTPPRARDDQAPSAHGARKSRSGTRPAGLRGDPETTGLRARWLGAGWLVGKLFGEELRNQENPREGPEVTALGPVGLVYSHVELSEDERLKLAEHLVREYHVPLAAVRKLDGTVWACTRRGRSVLPREASDVFGADHPFLVDIAADFVRLCHHPDAGDVVLEGWHQARESLSFVIQHGAHAGSGPEETGAFALLPHDAPLPENVKGYLRPMDVRRAALRVLGRPPEPEEEIDRGLLAPSTFAISMRSPNSVRIATYNVHVCIGMDGQLSPHRIARVIAQTGADIVALQELDVGRQRTGFRDQALEIARHLEMDCHFHASVRVEEELYGDAILSRFPIELIKSGPLPAVSERHEPRGAIWLAIDLNDGRRLQVLNTHLSIFPKERLLQARSIMSEEWALKAIASGPTVLCGDFNAMPGSPAYKTCTEYLRDAPLCLATARQVRATGTWFNPFPMARIDHIFVSGECVVRHAGVVRTQLAKVASDHMPVVVELQLA
jgi:endonuclease/exonuclease/phosphatase family metal-dependent hydrolase